MSKHDDFLEHIRLHVDAFAALANSKEMDEYCEEHRQNILDTLEAYEITESQIVQARKKKPEDVIGDEFNRFIQGV